MGVAKWLNSATWNAAPRFPFDRSSQKSQTRCIGDQSYKKVLLEHYEKRKRKSAILHLVAILAIFHTFT